MKRHLADHDHEPNAGKRAEVNSRLERIKAGEAGHPKIQMLSRRQRKGSSDATRVKQFLRIERGYLA